MRLVFAAWLVGCADDPVDPAWPDAQAPAPYLLTLQPPTGVRDGVEAAFGVSGAQPGDRIHLAYSVDGAVENGGPCPARLQGLCLDLLTPVRFARATANPDGRRMIRATVPLPVHTEVCFQAGVSQGPRGAIAAVSPTWCTTIQPQFGAAPDPTTSQDIWTTSVYAYTGPGAGPGGGLNDEVLKVGGWGDTYASFIRFPDLSALPAVAPYAEIQLYTVLWSTGGPTNLMVEQVLGPWDWTNRGTGPDRLRLWWQDQPATASFSGPLAPAAPGAWQRIDVTALYNAWQAGSAVNEGIRIAPTSTWNNYVFFASSETTLGPAFRPRLAVWPHAYEGHGYEVPGAALSWDEAVATCEGRGLRLARPDSAGEDAFLASITGEDAWIDAQDAAAEGTWTDADGAALGHAGWAAGEPSGGAAANCAALDPSGAWRALDCAGALRFACETL